MIDLPLIDLRATGENICRLRKAAGLSVKDLQKIFGFGTPQAIYNWQHGTALPSVDNLVFLSVVFGVPIDEILVLEYHQLIQGSDCEISGMEKPEDMKQAGPGSGKASGQKSLKEYKESRKGMSAV